MCTVRRIGLRTKITRDMKNKIKKGSTFSVSKVTEAIITGAHGLKLKTFKSLMLYLSITSKSLY